MGLLDKSKESALKLGNKAKELGDKGVAAAKEAGIKSISMVREEDIADMIIAATDKQAKVNALLEQRGSDVRVNGVTVSMGPPPKISLAVIRK